jgi:amino acid adenylation domain-containing protein
MSPLQFLNRLQSLNITVWLDGGRLRFRAPVAGLTESIRAELTDRKEDLVNFLQQLQSPRAATSAAAPPPEPSGREGTIALSLAQQRIWFLDRLQPGVPAYNMHDALEIPEEIDLDALHEAVNALVQRHEILRTVFPAVNGIPAQCIMPATPVPIPLVDLSGLPPAERIAAAVRKSAAQSSAPFDLERGPLLRIHLLRLEPARYVWLLSLHHIISDDGSMKLFYRELEALYRAFAAGKEPQLPKLPIQWADFTLWQSKWLQGEVLDTHVKYWAGQLAGELPVLNLAMDHPRRDPATGRNGRFHFPAALAHSVHRLCAAEGVTLFMAVLAAYAALLSRHTGQQDLIIGSPIVDRSRIETESLIGFFLNTLPLRIRVTEDAPFRSLLQQVREICLGAYSYQDVPYESLLQQLAVERNSSGNPLFQTMLVLHNTDPAQPSAASLWKPLPGWGDTDVESDGNAVLAAEGPAYATEPGNGATKFDLSITLAEHDGLHGKVEYNGDNFDAATISRLIGEYQVLLSSATADPMQRIGDLPLLTEPQRRALLQISRGTEMSFESCCLSELVERHASLQPYAVAVEEQGKQLTYGELNGQANQLARHLHARGIGPEDKVGVYLERSRQWLVAMLGVLKAGAAYVPLDPAHPREHLQLIAEDAQLAMLVTTEALAANLQSSPQRTICLDRDILAIGSHGMLDLRCKASAENLACVLYTSGSTGRPKGVLLTHAALTNFIHGASRYCSMVDTDRVLQFHSIGADSSIEECFLALCRGATLVLRSEQIIDSAAGFMDRCRELKLTLLVLPTAYWHELVSGLGPFEFPPCVRLIIIGGERALPEKVSRWIQHVRGRIDLVNAYGPTEGAIAVTRCRIGAVVAGTEVSIGHPVVNSTVYVLDKWLQPVPLGVPGEVYLGGAALARGYLGRPGMTAERFVPDSFGSLPGARLYRTGDVARYLPDGTLEYRGRVDHQVKIRGYRVEPREVEAVLEQLVWVKDAVVVAREDEPGSKRLIAYVVLRAGKEAAARELHAAMKVKLPSYMLPAAFVFLPVLPLNVNGKVNRAALPDPVVSRAHNGAAEDDREQWRTPTEKLLGGIWSTVLKLERVGRKEDFFELGGHSLLAAQIIARVNEAWNIDLPLRRIFESSTLAELSRVIDRVIQAGGGTNDAEVRHENSERAHV